MSLAPGRAASGVAVRALARRVVSWAARAVRRSASVAYYFVVMNLAIAVGFWRFMRGSQTPAWDRTARA